MNSSAIFFLLGMLVCPISVIVAVIFGLQYLYRKARNDTEAKTSLKKTKYAAAGFGTGILLFICALSQTPGAPPPTALTPEERAQQDAYDKQAQYEEWIAWQKSEQEKAEDAALQDAYDQQAQYEEWMAWKASEQEKAEAEENKYAKCTADQMLADYENNTVRAKSQYKGTYVKVSGKVGTISENGFLLDAFDEDEIYFEAICCTVDGDQGLLKSLNRGQTVVVYGKVSDVGDVVAKSSWGDGGITGYAIRVVKVQE